MGLTDYKNQIPLTGGDALPTPPPTEDEASSRSVSSSASSADDSPLFPLPPPSDESKLEVLDLDKPTPDHHVRRDPRLIRLTGVHPFNVEAPLTALFNEGFLTSPELFYVRNHGPVPQVLDNEILDWEVSVEGCVFASKKSSKQPNKQTERCRTHSHSRCATFSRNTTMSHTPSHSSARETEGKSRMSLGKQKVSRGARRVSRTRFGRVWPWQTSLQRRSPRGRANMCAWRERINW